jgi:hypothetical protein
MTNFAYLLQQASQLAPQAAPPVVEGIPAWVGFILTTATMFIVVGVQWGLQKSQIKELSDRHERLQTDTTNFKVDHEKRIAILSQDAAATEVKIDQVIRELGTKASAESVQEIKSQLSKIDAKLDALLVRKNTLD